jgi:hypothetical protein
MGPDKIRQKAILVELLATSGILFYVFESGIVFIVAYL